MERDNWKQQGKSPHLNSSKKLCSPWQVTVGTSARLSVDTAMACSSSRKGQMAEGGHIQEICACACLCAYIMRVCVLVGICWGASVSSCFILLPWARSDMQTWGMEVPGGEFRNLLQQIPAVSSWWKVMSISLTAAHFPSRPFRRWICAPWTHFLLSASYQFTLAIVISGRLASDNWGQFTFSSLN